MMRRKRRVGVLSLIVFLIGLYAVSASEVAAVWTRLYERANSLSQRYHIMLNIVEQDNKDMIPVLTKALDELVSNFQNVTDTSLKQRQIDLTKMVVKELGYLKARDASNLVWDVVQTTDDTLLKGEAVLALGKMGARQYGEQMAKMLRNLNWAGGDVSNKRDNEILAYSLVKAFERLKHEAGLEPVFFASRGWYSNRSGVKEAAKKALQVMTDDPTDMLAEVIETNDDYKWKLAALEAERNSDAPDQRKGEVAALALEKGFRLSPNNMIEKRQLRQLRLTSLKMLTGLPKPDDPQLIKNIDNMLTDYWRNKESSDYELDEILQLIYTMGTFENDEVARILVDFMENMNNARSSGRMVELRVAKLTINSLGNIMGNEAISEGVRQMAISQLVNAGAIRQWEGSIQRLAESTLEKIQ